jgi:hypothetical protein
MNTTRAFALLQEFLPVLGVVALITGALWAGILFSVSWLSGRARWMADGTEVGTLALALDRRWATPCLVACIASALAWACVTPSWLPGGPWLIGLGALLLVLVALHSSVSTRALRVARGSVSATRGEGLRRLMLVVSLAAVTALVGLRLGQG